MRFKVKTATPFRNARIERFPQRVLDLSKYTQILVINMSGEEVQIEGDVSATVPHGKSTSLPAGTDQIVLDGKGNPRQVRVQAF